MVQLAVLILVVVHTWVCNMNLDLDCEELVAKNECHNVSRFGEYSFSNLLNSVPRLAL